MYELLPCTQPIHKLDYVSISFSLPAHQLVPLKKSGIKNFSNSSGMGETTTPAANQSSNSMDGNSGNSNLKSVVCLYTTRALNSPLLHFSISLKDFQKLGKYSVLLFH